MDQFSQPTLFKKKYKPKQRNRFLCWVEQRGYWNRNPNIIKNKV